RFLGSDEYRRAKSVLMVKIAARFGHLLRIAKIDHGEHRFEVSDNQSQWLNLAIKCLTAFTPWSSLANCAQFAADTRSRQALTRLVTDRSDDRNESELKYCHMLIEPKCYYQLMKDLGFAAPETKLALPRFFMLEKREDDD